jgi:5-methylcytosine-specific restriction enzyme A
LNQDADNAFAEIERISAERYLYALEAVQPTMRELNILTIHRSAPDCTITARHLSRALGFANWNAANLRYGKFAGKLCRALGVQPKTNLSVLVKFFKVPGLEYELCLRPSVVEALDRFGLAPDRSSVLQEELGMQIELTEGASYTVQVNAFERNPVARQMCIAHYGTTCSVCGFDFGATYGRVADGYVQVHHLIPLASIGEEYVVDPVRDLRPVCANCHSVIHLRQPPYEIDDLCKILDGVKSTNE